MQESLSYIIVLNYHAPVVDMFPFRQGSALLRARNFKAPNSPGPQYAVESSDFVNLPPGHLMPIRNRSRSNNRLLYDCRPVGAGQRMHIGTKPLNRCRTAFLASLQAVTTHRIAIRPNSMDPCS